ncbi:MAG: Gfo/Idh/MocA family oxidoreductase [Spirochaetia bacterium]|jgi:predicted dehydrogenase|nr:Gfo/Idh/MocA family oxidoreductase [Spirochaetales bacterium]MDX9784790.1 Gfo/Idh/MocA family oxidoreductase [Spirochaetia bacterium]
MKRIRAGIIGVGNIGNAHVEAIKRLGYADVAAVCVREEARAKELCGYFGIPKYFTDYRVMLKDPEIDVVHNCTPNTAHFQINKDTILAGKHVLSEKPLTVYSSESEELVDLLKSHNVKNSINFVYRHYSLVQHVKGMIESGALGDIYAIHGTYLQDWLLYDTDYNWRVDEKLGGPSRAMADIGSHWCDLAQFLLGQDISEVCADLATFIPFRIDSGSGAAPGRRVAVDTEDYGSALLRFTGGARGSFTVSQASAGSKIGLSFGIDGSKASVRWEHGQADRLWIGHRDSPNEELTLHPGLLNERGQRDAHRGGKSERWPDAQKNMIDSFYQTILHGDEPRYADFAEGHRITRVVEAILESSRNRRWEKV